MAHRTARSAYRELGERLNRFPQGAPPSDLLYRILEMLFSEREASLVSQLPILPFTAEQAGRRWKVSESEARSVLEKLADRAILLDVEVDGESHYVLPPPMAGFFEFSLMRVRGDLDQEVLSELFYRYLNQEEEFVRELFTRGETQLGRVFVSEPALCADDALHVLDHERASQVIESATHIGVGICYCRHKMSHLDRACDAPMDICMTFNAAAASLIRRGHVHSVDRVRCMELLDQAREHGLVQFGENVRQGVNFICNCCGCCCEALIAVRRFGSLHPVHTTSFIASIDQQACKGCSRCARACPVQAIHIVSARDPSRPRRKVARLDEDVCLGCGVCVAACLKNNVTLQAREKRILTPLSTFHRTVVMAIERGTLQNIIVDNHLLASHRAMAAVLGVILRLPPVKQAAARQVLRSRYLTNLVERLAPRVTTS